MNPSLARNNNGIESGEEELNDYVVQTFSFEKGNSLQLINDNFAHSRRLKFQTILAFLYGGLIGPAIPLNQSAAEEGSEGDVTLAAGFDSDFFNFFPWHLQKSVNGSGKCPILSKDHTLHHNLYTSKYQFRYLKSNVSESAVPQVSYSPKKTEVDHSETERYNRLSFAVRDPRGRIVSGARIIF